REQHHAAHRMAERDAHRGVPELVGEDAQPEQDREADSGQIRSAGAHIWHRGVDHRCIEGGQQDRDDQPRGTYDYRNVPNVPYYDAGPERSSRWRVGHEGDATALLERRAREERLPFNRW